MPVNKEHLARLRAEQEANDRKAVVDIAARLGREALPPEVSESISDAEIARAEENIVKDHGGGKRRKGSGDDFGEGSSKHTYPGRARPS